MSLMQRKFSGCIRGYKVNDAGLKIGEIFSFGDIATLNLDIQKSLIKAISNQCGTAGQTLKSRARPAVASGSMACNEWQPDVVVEALGATVSAQTITAATLTEESVTMVGFGYWKEIGEKRLSSTVVKDAAAGNELVAGVDYIIDEFMGLIKPVEGSSFFLLGTEEAFVTSTAAEDTTPVYTIGAGTAGTYALTGHLEDAWSNKEGEFFLRKCRLVLTSSVPVVAGIDDELSPLEFEVAPEIVEGQSGFGTFAGEVLG